MQQIKNNVTEVKNGFDRFISRPNMAEEALFEPEVISVKTSKAEKQKKTMKKIRKNVQELWDNYKRCNICIMGIPK